MPVSVQCQQLLVTDSS